MSPRRPSRPVAHRTNFELARSLAPLAAELLELRRRFAAEEARLTALLGEDDPPSFEDFVAWVVERGSRPPHRPLGRPEGAEARRRRSEAARRRHQRERQQRLTASSVAA